jgi:hypothetical protein
VEHTRRFFTILFAILFVILFTILLAVVDILCILLSIRSQSGDVVFAGILLDEDDISSTLSEKPRHELTQKDVVSWPPHMPSSQMSASSLAHVRTNWQAFTGTLIAESTY